MFRRVLQQSLLCADPKPHQASSVLSVPGLTIVPAGNNGETCPEEPKRMRQPPAETTQLCVADSPMLFYRSLFRFGFASPAPKGDRKQGGDESFTGPGGRNGGGGVIDAEEWPAWSTLLNFKCFFKRSTCCVTLNSRVWPEPRCLRQ